MPPAFTDDDVRRIATLAQLHIAGDEVTRFAEQIRRILAYAEIVQEVDTSDVAPTAHVGLSPASGVWREDEPAPSLPRDAVLDGAPAANRDAGLIRVPKVL